MHPVFDQYGSSLDALARATASAALLLFLTTSCDQLTSTSSDSTAECETNDGSTTNADADQDNDDTVSCLADDTEATAAVTSSGSGAAIATSAIATGDDSDATASGTQRLCVDASETSDVGVSRFFSKLKFDRFCPDDTGSGSVAISLVLSKNGEAAVPVIDGTASIGCDDTAVTKTGDLPDCAASLPGSRYVCQGNDFIADVLHVEPGDSIEAIFSTDTHADFAPGSQAPQAFEVTTQVSYSFSGAGLAVGDCADAAGCQTNADCQGVGELCLDGGCDVLSFATDPNPDVSTDPDPLGPAQTFDVAGTVNATAGDLLPYVITISVASEAFDLNGTLAPGQVAGGCNLNPGNIILPIVAGDTSDLLYVNLDGNAGLGPTDATATFADDGSGAFVIVITIPPQADRLTVPVNATVTCSLSSFFNSGAQGVYLVSLDAISIDLDTGGADDGSGTAPLTYSDQFNLRIGVAGTTSTTTSTITTTTVPPAAGCADPVSLTAEALGGGARDAVVTASDSLFILRTAVGIETCVLCVCDVDGGGTVAASDALLSLKAAVGQQVQLSCPACT